MTNLKIRIWKNYGDKSYWFVARDIIVNKKQVWSEFGFDPYALNLEISNMLSGNVIVVDFDIDNFNTMGLDVQNQYKNCLCYESRKQ